MTLFSHTAVGADDSEMRALYAKAVSADAKRFLLWRKQHLARFKQPVPEAFGAWWMLVGPIAFKTVGDAVTYKKAVLATVQDLLDQGNVDI